MLGLSLRVPSPNHKHLSARPTARDRHPTPNLGHNLGQNLDAERLAQAAQNTKFAMCFSSDPQPQASPPPPAPEACVGSASGSGPVPTSPRRRRGNWCCFFLACLKRSAPAANRAPQVGRRTPAPHAMQAPGVPCRRASQALRSCASRSGRGRSRRRPCVGPLPGLLSQGSRARVASILLWPMCGTRHGASEPKRSLRRG